MIEKILSSQDINFIGSWFIDDLTICDDLITYFNTYPEKQAQGYTSKGIESKIKKSTDMAVFENTDAPEVINYLAALKKISYQYIKKFPAAAATANWGIKERINIQYYKPEEGYYEYHSERMSAARLINARHLVFMTYLNTVTDGGETEFCHQKLKVSAEKGLTLIWPVDWTYLHRGIPSPSQDKYIITGWFSFYE